MDVLLKNNKIDKSIFDKTHEFLEANKYVPVAQSAPETSVTKELDFESRAKLAKNQVSKKLFEIMAAKQSNLCLAADFVNFNELIKVKYLFKLVYI